MPSNQQWILFAAIIGHICATDKVNLEKHLQPDDDVDRYTYLHPSKNSSICARDCTAGGKPKICYYKWVLENYVTLGDACGNCPRNKTECFHTQCVTADGYERGILAVNRKLPGPSIEVCLGDRIIVDVKNDLVGRSTTIHWHGVFQKGSQFMDGVPLLTQCAIYEGHTFRYDFRANNEGTHYWHSHDGLQKLDGIQGNLVIRTPKSEDPNGALYDYDLPEHKMFINDWMRLDADQHFPGLLVSNKGQDADSFLINGKGRTVIGAQSTTTPLAEFKVQYGKKYRFRLIGGLCTVCPTQITIQGHQMTVIATDGNPVEPRRVDSINLYSGERYDVVVEANETPGRYWIHVKGLATCVPGRVYQLGVLQYEHAGVKASEDPGYDGFQINNNVILNPENGSCTTNSNGLCPSQLVSSFPVSKNILNQLPDFNFLTSFGFNVFDRSRMFEPHNFERYFVSPELELLSSTMNNISFITPPAPPLTQPRDVPQEVYCPKNSEGVPACPKNKPYCMCVHLLEVPLGSVVQLTLSDETPRSGLHHPFHLHGYAFHVMEMAQYKPGQTYKDIMKKQKSKVVTQSPAPALKDSIAVSSTGYAVVKFKADNPGYWFLHCHFMYHHVTGMALVIKVGRNSQMPRPPRNFPKCNNFMNEVHT